MIKRKLSLAVTAALMAIAGSANAGVFQFSTVGLGGSDTFLADEISLTAVGSSTVTITDDGDGVIDGIVGSGDTFVETGLIQSIGFQLGGTSLSPLDTGNQIRYELFVVYDGVSGGPLSGTVGVLGTDVIANFTPPTNATIWYDTAVAGAGNSGVFNLGSSTQIGSMTLDTSQTNNCVLPQLGAAEGTCVLTAFLSTLLDDVFTSGGNDLEGARVRMDYNVDQVSPGPFTSVFDASGTQSRTIDHDGSARIDAIPEPATMALLGMGLLGFAGLRRRS